MRLLTGVDAPPDLVGRELQRGAIVTIDAERSRLRVLPL